jgi:DNA replication and repair protein RecF
VVSHITLQNYRNLNIELALDPSANLIIAPNGSGKSNVLEALYLISTGNTFIPLQSLADLVGPEQDFAKANIQLADTQIAVIVANKPRLQRKFEVGAKAKRLKDVVGRLPVILFAPQSVDLLNSDPSSRRQDLDDYLAILNSAYAASRQRYYKVLRNRNAVLKNIREGNSQANELVFWTAEMVKHGSYMQIERIKMFDHIALLVQQCAEQLYQGSTPELEIVYAYKGEASYESWLQSKFDSNQDKEVAAGQTLYGPHRDDYSLVLNAKNLRYQGSRGQQRLAVFTWKLAQHHYFMQLKEQAPMLLIDDLMSELDETHRQNVANYLLNKHTGQFILTAADKKDVPSVLLKKSKNLLLEKSQEVA